MKTSVVHMFMVAAMLIGAPGVLARAPAKPPVQAVQGGDAPVSTGKAVAPASGEQVYRQVCQACHMADGKGGTGAATIPALANNDRVGSSDYVITMVVKGRGAMPSLTDILKPDQIAHVTSYVRTHFGNSFAKPVTTAEVMQLETAPK